MTHYVCDECIKCKYKDCVEVCPVDCFYEGEYTLVIDPDTCIDCGVCIPECPVNAIRSDIEDTIDPFWMKFNKKFSSIWPNVTEKGNPHPEAEIFKNKKNKIKNIKNITLDE